MASRAGMVAMGRTPNAQIASVVVPRLWPDSTIVCLGTGPSLRRDDVEYCHGKARIIAVNDAYLYAPFADVLYAADEKWWRAQRGVPSFPGIKYSLSPTTRWPGVKVLRRSPGEGLELDPHGVKTGRNSGYQAINVAVHLGAARILLLGYDMKRGEKGKSHFFGEHPDGQQSPYDRFILAFRALVQPLAALKIDIVNCTRETHLTYFRRQPLHEALP